jgi:hypothetical protein
VRIRKKKGKERKVAGAPEILSGGARRFISGRRTRAETRPAHKGRLRARRRKRAAAFRGGIVLLLADDGWRSQKR